MITVSDIEEIREELLDVFPDAIRGSVAKSYWGAGRKTLHLSYWTSSDTVGGFIIKGSGDLVYFIEWDSNSGHEYQFAESDTYKMVNRVRAMFAGQVVKIIRMVKF